MDSVITYFPERKHAKIYPILLGVFGIYSKQILRQFSHPMIVM